MKQLSTRASKISDERLLAIMHILRRLKMYVIDYTRMTVNYGLLGDLISQLKTLSHYFFQRLHTQQNSSLSRQIRVKDRLDFQNRFLNSTSYSQASSGISDDYPIISIITPNRNQGAVLEKCIQSVLLQNYPNLEYIVIDRGSTDASLDIMKKYANRIAFCLSEGNGSKPEAINRALEYATGVLFNWLNPDDYLEPNALFRCAQAYRENPSAVGWVGATRVRNAAGSVLKIIYPNGLERQDLGYNWNHGQFYQASCFLLTAEVKELGGINPDLSTPFGIDLWLRLLEKGHFVSAKGIWSNTLIQLYPDRELTTKQAPEINRLKEKFGFHTDNHIWTRSKYKQRKRLYSIPSSLNSKLKKLTDFHKTSRCTFDNPPNITFMGYTVPRFDKSSAEFRVHNILNIFAASNCKISYIYYAKVKNQVRYEKAFKGLICFRRCPLDLDNYIRILRYINPEYIWITELWRIEYLSFMAKLTQKLKKELPFCKVIVDTVDFHFKEFYRKYEWTQNQHDLSLANDYLNNETTLYKAADSVLVVTEEEKRDIQAKLPGITYIDVVPNVHQVSNLFRPYTKRRNICFVGNFGTNHNADAVHYFLQEIFQFILKRSPTVEFHVLGYLSENHRKVFSRPNVKVIGSLRHLQKALSYYKLFVCPMTYGAGMKGKIGGAMAAATPVVTTAIGAEGFPVIDGQECFIADAPEELGEKCNQCLNDPVLWYNFSLKSRLMIAENFSPGVVAIKLKEILSK